MISAEIDQLGIAIALKRFSDAIISSDTKKIVDFLESANTPGSPESAVCSHRIKRLKSGAAHLQEVFGMHLGVLPEQPKLLFLGSGYGGELVETRDIYPEAELFAVEKEHEGNAIFSGIISDTKMQYGDIGTQTPDFFYDKYKVIPDAVIVRHPEIKKNPQIHQTFGEWAAVMGNSGGRLLVTTFIDFERDSVVNGLVERGFNPSLSEFEDGIYADVISLTGSIVRMQQDRYIITI